MMLRVHAPWLMLVVLLLAGCGVSREAPVRVTPPAPDAKETLQQIAETGKLKSLKQQLYQELDGLREAKPELAEELMADYQQLVEEKNPDQVKTMAQEMADKL